MTGHLLQEPHHDGSPLASATSWNILGSHDSARIRTVVGSPEAHRVAAGLQFTLPWAHVGDDTLAFLREHPEETLLVVARRAPGPPLDLPITVGETVVATADDPLTTGVTVYAV